MSLIARHFEAKGLPTLILGSALDILTAGRPPRAKFVNYPLGFEAGRFRDQANQLAVVREAVQGFAEFTAPGVAAMRHEWPEGWALVNAREQGKPDQRSPRTREPQYQTEDDRVAAGHAPAGADTVMGNNREQI